MTVGKINHSSRIVYTSRNNFLYLFISHENFRHKINSEGFKKKKFNVEKFFFFAENLVRVIKDRLKYIDISGQFPINLSFHKTVVSGSALNIT